MSSRNRLLGLAFISLMLYGLTDNIRSPLYPAILKEFSLNDLSGSLFFSLSSVFSFVGGLSVPFWLRRLEALNALRLSIFLCFLALAAASQSQSYPGLLFCIMLFGLSLGIMGVLQNFIVVRASPAHLKTKIVNGLHSMYALASLGAASSVIGISELLQYFGISGTLWRTCFVFSAGSTLLVLALTYIFSVPKKFVSSINPQAVPKHLDGKGSPTRTLKAWTFGLMLSSYTLTEILVATRLPLYFQRLEGSSVEGGGLWLMLFYLLFLASRTLFSFWTPKQSVRGMIALGLTLTTVFLLLGVFVYSPLLALSGFFMGPCYPLMMVKVSGEFEHKLSVILSRGIAMTALFVVVMNFMVGAATDQWGLRIAYLIAPFFSGFALFLLWFERRREKTTA